LALASPDPEDEVANVALTGLKQTVGLPVGAADDLDFAALHEATQLVQRLRAVLRQLLVADGIKVHAATHTVPLAERAHIANAPRQNVVSPQPLHVDPVHVVAERVSEASLHARCLTANASCYAAGGSSSIMTMNAATTVGSKCEPLPSKMIFLASSDGIAPR